MSAPYDPVIVRAEDAEYLPSIRHFLLADGSATANALSTHRITLAAGTAGARPHRHRIGSELFFVLDGALHLLVGDEVLTATAGDLAVVPPGTDHAFAAHAETGADALIVITPGLDRFEYLRQVEAIRSGQADPAGLDDQQQRYDTYFVESAAWEKVLPPFPADPYPTCSESRIASSMPGHSPTLNSWTRLKP
jgi:quercetin dioxygenase-like cupin family protein